MSRTTPITARQVEVLLDLQDAFHRLASADGVITTSEAQVADLISIALAKGERIDRTRRIGRAIEDSGEMTPWALRSARELERDLAPIMRLDDYRAENSTA